MCFNAPHPTTTCSWAVNGQGILPKSSVFIPKIVQGSHRGTFSNCTIVACEEVMNPGQKHILNINENIFISRVLKYKYVYFWVLKYEYIYLFPEK